ncbi:conserved hypothetical protein [Magnetospirillum sp. LM-5]|uniref:endonuclease domain-containing protein n=1 Tax=Magnetospirillum sp. LM-5 TaxID=2681466 RepID=UPI00137DE040|nr:endonuclease domain-containing protein [Magnetospirillum sp. LM-5]CAA7616469.1 conserved hypothetical protein [Magnetospirillum sp. LM-5]
MADKRARWLRANQTEAERHLWLRLRVLRSEGSHFRRQAPIGPFIVDFACHARRLVVELDGGQHAVPEHRDRDRDRTVWLESQGYRVLRFWNNDVLGNADGVMVVVREALGFRDASATPHPLPLPIKGRGDD